MYVELSNNQKLIEALQTTLQKKDEELSQLKNGQKDDRSGD